MKKTNQIKKFKPVKSVLALTAAILIAGVSSFGNVVLAADYTAAFAGKQDAIYAGAQLNERIAQEGMVLLKNEDNALPLTAEGDAETTKITVFGYASVAPTGGGSTTGGDMSAGVTRLSSDIYSSLEDAGFEVNQTVEEQYRQWLADEKTSDYELREDFNEAKDTFESSFSEYNDAAIVVLTSTGAYPVTSIFGGMLNVKASDGKLMNEEAVPEGDSVSRAHSMMLDKAQLELLKYANDNFDKVVVVINESTPIELGFLQDNDTYPNVKAALLAGAPGGNGFNALGQILNGTVNPSGRLVDLYARDFTTIPAWVNWGDNGTAADYGEAGTDGSYTMTPLTAGGSGYIDAEGNARAGLFTDYEEGIYVGYRYYETRGYTESQANAASTWYDDNVVYPFGYGLSYTTFDWEVAGSSPAADTVITEKDTIKIEVKVTNTGDVAGKDVVEVYYTAPYTLNGIEKSHVVLADYAKTKLLEPGEEEVLTLEFDSIDMASYDWNDQNGNDNKGYELEAGEYAVKVMKNSHDVVSELTYNVESTILCKTSLVTGNSVENRFDYVNEVIESNSDKTVLSRADWEGTWPQVPTIDLESPENDGRYVSDEDFANWTLTVTEESDKAAPWGAKQVPTVADAATRPEEASITLDELVGKDYDDAVWDTLLDQLTLQEMMDLINNGGFNTIEIPYIGKPFAFDTDGPKGWSGTGVGGEDYTAFASAPVLASTWSKELAYEMGEIIGEQALWGNSDLEEGIKTYSGWYAPGLNTHRTPLDSRYTEYYSEDGYLAGEFAANVIQGARSKGVYVTIKHFAMHENGSFTDRGIMQGEGAETSGLSIWCNEQAMREIYFKPFRITVEEANPGAAMSSFSRIGYTWAGASYPLLTELLRNEWGFKGFVISDIEIYNFMDANAMVRAGGDLVLSSGKQAPRQVTESAGDEATHITAIRQAVKNILYVVANSNAMQIPMGAAVQYNGTELENVSVNTKYTAELGGAVLNTVTELTSIEYLVSSGNLPEGLELDANTGTITGTPTQSGTFTFDVTAAAAGYQSAQVTYSLVVEAAGAADNAATTGAATENKTTGLSTYVLIAVVIIVIVAAVVFFILKSKKKNK